MKRVLAENFGKVGAVNQDATGTPPEGSAHTLVVGAGVVYKENIQTSAQWRKWFRRCAARPAKAAAPRRPRRRRSSPQIGTVILNRPMHPPGTDPLGYTSIFTGGNEAARNKSQATQLKSGVAPPPPPHGAH
jgi:hypothetical protein